MVASGFTLIFGLMRVDEHGPRLAVPAQQLLALQMQTSWFQQKSDDLEIGFSASSDATYELVGWLVPVLLAALAIGLLGLLIQQVFLRWNQGQELRQALITIAISVILADQMLGIFGGV